MASVLKVDSIEPANSATGLKGTIIETLAGVCDGTTVTVQSGTYQFPNVTTSQNLSTTYADVTGSSIDYTPPNGTSRVVYEFNYQQAWSSGSHCISHWKLFLDNVEVTNYRKNLSGTYPEQIPTHKWVFTIGVSDTPATGAVSSWNVAKNIKLQAREYGGSNAADRIHGTYYWDGGASQQFSHPTLQITAIR
mgnify:FL=1